MSHPDQLRQYARDCLRLSQDMTSPELKIHLINMAEAWAALASQSERIATLCASVPLEAIASGPLAPDGERPGGPDPAARDRSAVDSPALSPEEPGGRMPEHSARVQPTNARDEQDR